MTKGLKIAAIAVVVGVVTYAGLEVLLPHHQVEVKLSGLVPANSVFDSKLKSPDEVAAAAEATPGATAADASTPSGPAVAGDDAMAASPDENAGQGATSDTTAAADDSDTASAGNDAGSADTATSDSDQAETAPASPAPQPTAPAAAPVKPAASKPAVKPSQPSSKPAATKPAVKKTPAAVASIATPWWTSSGSAGLHVIYVGSAAFERAVVVMGNASFASASSANQNIHVSDASGKAVAGSWKLGSNNKAMLVFPVSKSGKFQISVGADLSDANSRKLGHAVKGPVVVQ